MNSFFKLRIPLVIVGLMGFFLPKPTLGQEPTTRICYTNQLPDLDSAQKGKRQGPLYDITDQDYHIIPVVFHVIHDGGPSDIDSSLIHSQIDVLNEDFGRYGNGYNEHPDGADVQVRFALANRDPQGQPTNGIIRVDSPEIAQLEISNEMATKRASHWPSKRYLNIWVVDTILASTQIQGTIQGYSRLPENAAGRPEDGVVMNYRYVGRKPNGNPQFELGKTTSHEVGHYLNLQHTWGPNGQSGCNEDDGIDDTPLCSNPFQSSYPNPCNVDNEAFECYNVERMTENYMDYSSDECLTIFTQGQKRHMRKAIEDYRSELVHYSNVHDAGLASFYDSMNSSSANQNLYPDVEIYPNPAGDFTWINTFSPNERPLVVRIKGLRGRVVKSVNLGAVGTDKTRMPLFDIAPGLYVIEVVYADSTFREKLMIY